MTCIMLHEQPEVGIRTVSFYSNEREARAALDAAYDHAMDEVDPTDPYFEDEQFHACPPGPYADGYAPADNCLYGAQLIYCDDIKEWYVYGDTADRGEMNP